MVEIRGGSQSLHPVATERQNVLDTVLLKLFQNLVDLCLVIVDAGQMRHGQHTVTLFQAACNGKGVLPVAAAAGTEGHADEVRMEILQCLQRVVDSLNGRGLFRGENFKRKNRFFCKQ